MRILSLAELLLMRLSVMVIVTNTTPSASETVLSFQNDFSIDDNVRTAECETQEEGKDPEDVDDTTQDKVEKIDNAGVKETVDTKNCIFNNYQTSNNLNLSEHHHFPIPSEWVSSLLSGR